MYNVCFIRLRLCRVSVGVWRLEASSESELEVLEEVEVEGGGAS